jgi:hypothetical protein
LPGSEIVTTMTGTSTRPSHRPASKALNVALWGVQWLLALTFVGTGIWKLATPIPELAAKMPWMGEVSPSFLHLTAALDLLVGLGVVLPSLTRIKPRLASFGALGCVALMVGSIVFHVQRGEAGNTPFNFFLAALAAFVAWGRYGQAPMSRGSDVGI